MTRRLARELAGKPRYWSWAYASGMFFAMLILWVM
jgi:hypothetical protein